jgi:hypothetical protein
MTVSMKKRTRQRDKGQTYSGKADFVPKVVEAADAVLSVLVVVVLDEAETEKGQHDHEQ